MIGRGMTARERLEDQWCADTAMLEDLHRQIKEARAVADRTHTASGAHRLVDMLDEMDGDLANYLRFRS